MPERIEGGAGRPIAQLRLVAQREQNLVAAGPRPGPGDGKDLLTGEVDRFAGLGRMGEGAVGADIAAQVCERHEHLARHGHIGPVAGIANRRRTVEKLRQGGCLGELPKLDRVEAASVHQAPGQRVDGGCAHQTVSRLKACLPRATRSSGRSRSRAKDASGKGRAPGSERWR